MERIFGIRFMCRSRDAAHLLPVSIRAFAALRVCKAFRGSSLGSAHASSTTNMGVEHGGGGARTFSDSPLRSGTRGLRTQNDPGGTTMGLDLIASRGKRKKE